MKTLLTYLIPLSILLSACGTEEIERLTAENAALKENQSQKEGVLTAYLAEFEEISNGIRDIAIREDLLLGMTIDEGELAASPEERIKDDLALIDALMIENKEKLEALETKLGKEKGEIREFKRIVADLRNDLADKESNITILRTEIESLEGDYEMLLSDYYDQTLMSRLQGQELTEQDIELHTAWFTYGTKQELEDNEVLEKVGGVLGVGRTHKLRDDFNKKYFTRVDIRELESIPLESKKVEIVSTHPADSFELVTEDEVIKAIKITDSARFWSASRYLAMVVK